MAVAAVSYAADALHRGSGTAQDDGRAREASQGKCGVPRLETRRPIALVGGVVLLVDHDQPHVGEWRGQCRSRPHDHVHLAGADPAPLVGPLPFPEAGMQDRDLRIQICAQPIHERHRQGDFRNQDQGRAAGGDRLGDGLGIDRGLARPGHSLKEQRRGVAAGGGGEYLRQRLCLGRRE